MILWEEVNGKKGTYYVGASAQTGRQFMTTTSSARQAKRDRERV